MGYPTYKDEESQLDRIEANQAIILSEIRRLGSSRWGRFMVRLRLRSIFARDWISRRRRYWSARWDDFLYRGSYRGTCYVNTGLGVRSQVLYLADYTDDQLDESGEPVLGIFRGGHRSIPDLVRYRVTDCPHLRFDDGAIIEHVIYSNGGERFIEGWAGNRYDWTWNELRDAYLEGIRKGRIS